MKQSRLLCVLAALAITVSFFSSTLHATDGVWAGSSSGNWSNPNAWENQAVPNGIDATATIGSKENRIRCEIDMPVTLGHLVFEDIASTSNRCDIANADDWNPKTIELKTTSGTPSITVNAYAEPSIYVSLIGKQGLNKFGPCTLYLSGGDFSNSYTGVTTIYAGSLEAGKSSALGADGVGNETMVRDGANLTVMRNANVSETITITGIGENNYFNDAIGALRLSDDGKVSGPITLSGDATIVQRDYWNTAEEGITGTITGTIALPDEADVTFRMHPSRDSFDAKNFRTKVSGAISGTGGVAVTGRGTLILSGNNTYSGGNTVSNSAVLSVSSDANLGDADNSVVLNGGTLKITGTNFTSTSRDIEIQSNSTIDIDASNSFTISQNLTGDNKLTKNGYGKLLLTGENKNFTGDIYIKKGTLDVGMDTQLRIQTRVTIADSATLKIQGNKSFGSLVGTRYAKLKVGEQSVQFGSDNTDTTYRGSITGNGIVRKAGTGTQVLTGNLAYKGDTEVREGRLILEGDNKAMTGDITVQNGATLRASDGNAISSSTRVKMQNGSTLTIQDDEDIGSLSGNGTINTTLFSAGHKLGIGQDNTDSTFYGTIIGEGGKLTKLGTGTLTLQGDNTYTGATVVQSGCLILEGDNEAMSGDITIKGGASLHALYGSAISSSSRVSMESGAMLFVEGDETIGSIAGDGTVNIERPASRASNLGVGQDNTDTTFSGSIIGEGNTLTKLGTGTLTLALTPPRTNEQTVNFAVEAGTLHLGGGNLESSDVDVAAGATLSLETDETIRLLSGAGSVVLPSKTEANPDAGLTICSETGSTIFSGVISGEGQLCKTGNHSLQLFGENEYSGGTVLKAGYVIADHNDAFGTGTVTFDGGNLQVNEGVTIANAIDFATERGGFIVGKGTIQGNIAVGDHCYVSPGGRLGSSDDIGQLTIDGNYTQDNEGYLYMQLGGTDAGEYDVLNIKGIANLDGTLHVALFNDFTPTNGDTFDILDWVTIAAASEFDSLNLPSLAEDLEWDTTNLYYTGKISVYDPSAVPEPSTLALLLTLPILAMLRRQRRV